MNDSAWGEVGREGGRQGGGLLPAPSCDGVLAQGEVPVLRKPLQARLHQVHARLDHPQWEGQHRQEVEKQGGKGVSSAPGSGPPAPPQQNPPSKGQK